MFALLLELLHEPGRRRGRQCRPIGDTKVLQHLLALSADSAHLTELPLLLCNNVTPGSPAAQGALAPVLGQWWRLAPLEVLLESGQGLITLPWQVAPQSHPLALTTGIDQQALLGTGAQQGLQKEGPVAQGESMLAGAVPARLQQGRLIAERPEAAGFTGAQQQRGTPPQSAAPQQQQTHFRGSGLQCLQAGRIL